MRIISGSFRGKKIYQPMNDKTRPLKDLVKESIFNIINHSKKFKIDLENANILDMFSGVGSFGIECLSRGVQEVVFVENYQGVIPILKKNLLNLKSVDNYKIIEKDIYNNNKIINLNIQFDIIFLDPPFKDKNLSIIFRKIKNENLLKETGIIILHRHKDEKDIFLEEFNIIEEKKYGISRIFFFSN
tara:strand:- start:1880 stop:2440 length:561 start_codon:yes stop_codon:yes gene_type:complete